MSSIFSLIGYPAIVGFIGLSFILAEKPEILEKLVGDVEDIQNYKTQGTGSWRYNQYKSYEPFIQEYIIGGMRFEGFELPEQFYKDYGDGGMEVKAFDDMTGHHIHIHYADYLFYFGIIGLLLFDLPATFFIARKVWRLRKKELTFEQIVFVSFAASGIFFAFSYVIPMSLYGLTGAALYLLDKEDPANKEEEFTLDEKVLATAP